MHSNHWQTSRYRIDLRRPCVMGIVNLTPDSFSDGGQHAHAASAIAHCERLVEEGVHILDLGAESSRPAATPLTVAEERARLMPVLKAVVDLGVPVSIDTFKPDIMREALDLGADIVNDIAALRLPGAVEAVAAHPRCGVCLMHMQGEPQTMQLAPDYQDVVEEVADFLGERAWLLREAGVAQDRIVLDPGIGFGKTVEHNLALLRDGERLPRLGYPLLLGWSRKSTLGALTGRPVGERLAASLAAALAAVQRGAKILRVHDVAATVDALKVWDAAGFPAAAGADVAKSDDILL